MLRVVALSGGFSRAEACRELARNPGMIASFSRALLSDLRHQMSDEEFDRSLGTAIDEIYQASTVKAVTLKREGEAIGARVGASGRELRRLHVDQGQRSASRYSAGSPSVRSRCW